MVRTPSVVELAWMCPLEMYGDCKEALVKERLGPGIQFTRQVARRLDLNQERFDADNLAVMDGTCVLEWVQQDA